MGNPSPNGAPSRGLGGRRTSTERARSARGYAAQAEVSRECGRNARRGRHLDCGEPPQGLYPKRFGIQHFRFRLAGALRCDSQDLRRSDSKRASRGTPDGARPRCSARLIPRAGDRSVECSGVIVRRHRQKGHLRLDLLEPSSSIKSGICSESGASYAASAIQKIAWSDRQARVPGCARFDDHGRRQGPRDQPGSALEGRKWTLPSHAGAGRPAQQGVWEHKLVNGCGSRLPGMRPRPSKRLMRSRCSVCRHRESWRRRRGRRRTSKHRRLWVITRGD